MSRRLIITQAQLSTLKEHLSENRLSEVIDPSDAYRDDDAIQTLIDGRRNVGFMSYMTTKKQWNIIKNAGLKRIPVGPKGSHIIYREEGVEDALALAKISNKHDGYLPTIDPVETYTIGKLLDYDESKVKAFVLKLFPKFTFH